MQQARIVDGVVIEVHPEHAKFHPDCGFVKIADGVTTGQIQQPDGTFKDPPKVDARQVLLTYAAGQRMSIQINSTVMVDGMDVPTDSDTKQTLTWAYTYLSVLKSNTVQWKLPNGQFAPLGLAQIKKMVTAVGQHIESCFAAEAEAVAGITLDPPTITAIDQIDQLYAHLKGNYKIPPVRRVKS